MIVSNSSYRTIELNWARVKKSLSKLFKLDSVDFIPSNRSNKLISLAS
jgi:hypothetical protein